MDQDGYKYRAFISYSHQDKAWGDWLHKALETYRVPKRLVGRASRDGNVPRRLYPVFRDREELPSSADLGNNIGEALRGSRYLVVICSPYSAASRWVDEEIKAFKRLGREDRVLALIVAGDPNASDKPGSGLVECFPPALRYRLGKDGQLSAERTEPIAADARAGKDGRANALLKLLAGLLGVDYAELKQRERARRIRRRLEWGAAAVLLAALAVGLWHWKSNRDLALQDVEQGRQALLAGDPFAAALYLDAAYALGDRSPATRLMLARALAPLTAPAHVWHTGRPLLDTELSADGRTLTTADAVSVRRWDVAQGKSTFELPFKQDGKVEEAKLSQTGRYAATLDGSEDLSLYDTADGTRRVLHASAVVDSVTFDADDTRLLATTIGKKVDVFDLASGRHTTMPHTGLSFEAQLDTRGARVLTIDHDALRVWDAARGTRLAIIPGDYATAYLEPDGKSVRTRRSGHEEFWDAASGRRLADLPAPIFRLLIDAPNMYFYPLDDGHRFLVMDRENKASLFDPDADDPYRSLPLLTDKTILDLLELEDRRLEVLTLESPGVLALRDPETELPMAELALSSPKLRHVRFVAGGTQVIAYDDDAVLVWQVRTEPQSFRARDYNWQEITAGQWSPDGGRLLLTTPDGSLSLFDLAAGKTTWTSPACKSVFAASVFDHLGRRIAAVCGDGSELLLDARDGHLLQGLGHSVMKPAHVTFSPDDAHLVIVGDETNLWDLASGAEFTVPRDQRSSDWYAAFTPDGKSLAAFGKNLRFVDLKDHSTATAAPFAHLGGEAVSEIPGGAVAIVDGTGFLRVDLTGRKFSAPLQFTTNQLHEAAVSPDGTRVLLVDEDGARVIGSSDGALVARLEQRAGTATLHRRSRIADVDEWDPVTGFDGRNDFVLVAAGSMLGLWDARDGRLLSILGRFPGLTSSAGLSPDGAHAAASDSGDLRVWDTHLETRSPEEVAAWLTCRVPWRLQGEKLVAATPALDACPHP